MIECIMLVGQIWVSSPSEKKIASLSQASAVQVSRDTLSLYTNGEFMYFDIPENQIVGDPALFIQGCIEDMKIKEKKADIEDAKFLIEVMLGRDPMTDNPKGKQE